MEGPPPGSGPSLQRGAEYARVVIGRLIEYASSRASQDARDALLNDRVPTGAPVKPFNAGLRHWRSHHR
jgi:hypothetical protein